MTDTGEGVGKRRLWRASTQYHSWTNSAFAGDDEHPHRARLAAAQLHPPVRGTCGALARRGAEGWPTEWVDALGLSDAFVTVTPEQLGRAGRRTRRLDRSATARWATATHAPGGSRLSPYTRPRRDHPPRSRSAERCPGAAAPTRPLGARRLRTDRDAMDAGRPRARPRGAAHAGAGAQPRPRSGVMIAIQGFVALALELPTGGLADAIGRRPLLLLAGTVAVGSAVVFVVRGHAAGVRRSPWALQGVFRALDSGPLEAWSVDTAQADDPAAPVERGLPRGATCSGLAIARGALASGGLVAWHPIAGGRPLVLPFCWPSWRNLGAPRAHRGARAREPRPSRTPATRQVWSSVAGGPTVGDHVAAGCCGTAPVLRVARGGRGVLERWR